MLSKYDKFDHSVNFNIKYKNIDNKTKALYNVIIAYRRMDSNEPDIQKHIKNDHRSNDMIQQAYFMDLYDTDNKCITDKELYVNSVGSSVFEEDFSGGHRTGRNDYHLLYLYSGELNIKYGNKKKHCTLKNGQLIIFSPKTPFIYTSTTKTKNEFLWINFTGSKVETLLESVNLPVNTPMTVNVPQFIFEGFETMFAEFRSRPGLYEVAIPYKLVHLMVLFSRARRRDISNRKSGPLTNALLYINNNYTKDISTEELANMEYISCTHFRRLFKEKTGMTPTQYIVLTRLKYAEQLLLETDMNIKQIADHVGFSSPLYFSRVFSNHFGVSPKDYRKR